MISVLPLKDKDYIKELFEKFGADFNEFSGAVEATCNDDKLGCAIYYLDSEKMTVLDIEPKNDLALADGILRSALHNAVCAKVMKAYYSDNAPVEILKKLKFILDEEEKSLNINKLFESCCSCSDKNT
ncbi:MAG: hypothetical protein E7565_07410 [Ruminococcaceae bacterium]|nr:hypothetical protein [Oscillospiraceae bacterium]